MSRSMFSAARFRRALRWFVAGRMAQALATLALTLLAVRLLPLPDYGAYMVLWGIVELGMPLTSLGLLPAVQRFLPEYAARGSAASLRRFVRLAALARLALILVFCAVLVGAWPAIAGWLGLPPLRGPVAYATAAVVLLVLINRFVAEMLECLLEQRYAQVARALLPIGRLVGLCALWAAGEVSLLNVLIVDVAAAALASLAAEVWLAQRMRALKPSGESTVVSGPELLKFIWHMSAAQVLNALSGVGAIRLIVARILGLEVAGVFSFLQQLMTIAGRYLPSTLLANMVRPLLISRHAAGHVTDVAVGHGLLWKMNVATAWPIVVLALVVGEPTVEWLSGGHIRGAGWPLVLLLVGLVAAAQTQVVNMALQVARRTDLVRNISALAVVAPVLVWALAPMGLAGAAAAVAMAALVRSAAGIFALQRLDEKAALDGHGVARILAVLALAALSGMALKSFLWWPWLAVSVVCVYLAGVGLSRPLAPSESELLVRALGPRFAWLGALAHRRRPW